MPYGGAKKTVQDRPEDSRIAILRGEFQCFQPVGCANAPYLIPELEFDCMADMQQAMASSEGQATASDLANFAQAGATMLACDTQSVLL